jgi:hypothetical protein
MTDAKLQRMPWKSNYIFPTLIQSWLKLSMIYLEKWLDVKTRQNNVTVMFKMQKWLLKILPLQRYCSLPNLSGNPSTSFPTGIMDSTNCNTINPRHRTAASRSKYTFQSSEILKFSTPYCACKKIHHFYAIHCSPMCQSTVLSSYMIYMSSQETNIFNTDTNRSHKWFYIVKHGP